MSGPSGELGRAEPGDPSETDAPGRPEDVRLLCDGFDNRSDALIEILHAVQERFGHVPPDAIPVIAGALNLSRAEVHGVVSFYHDFHTAPVGRHVIRLCRAEACQAVGANALVAHACSALGIGPGETTADGAVTLEEAFCLGNCALGPAAMVDGELTARLSPERFDQMVAEARATAFEAAE